MHQYIPSTSRLINMHSLLEIMISLILILLATILPSYAQSTNSTCTHYNFIQPHHFKTCIDFPVLNSSLHYTYHPHTETLHLAYRHPGMGGPAAPKWVAWALNPTSKGMIGAQALVAYRSPKDESLIVAYTSPITSYETTLAKGDLSYNVTKLKAEVINDDIIIFATIMVPNNNGTVLNQLWQEGPLSNDGTPQRHSLSGPNVRSMTTLNLLSGGIAPASGQSWQNVHGAINVVSWGLLMPLGAMIASYVRVIPSADPLWFYLHVGCQVTAYILGVTGLASGHILTSGPHHAHYPIHRCLGNILFSMATLQVISLFARPNRNHKYRVHWNIYHHFFGYATIFLSIANIFKGFQILNPDKKWRTSYISVVVTLAMISFIMEGIKYYILSKRM